MASIFLSGSSPFKKYLQKCRVTFKCLYRIAFADVLFHFFHKIAPLCILSFQCLICSSMHMLICIPSLQVQTQSDDSDPSLHPTHPFFLLNFGCSFVLPAKLLACLHCIDKFEIFQYWVWCLHLFVSYLECFNSIGKSMVLCFLY